MHTIAHPSSSIYKFRRYYLQQTKGEQRTGQKQQAPECQKYDTKEANDSPKERRKC